jgi:APA family basic amino acid/polyamine antiporter
MPLDYSRDQPELEPAKLPRLLGSFDATCIVIGAIIGVGIFFTPTRVATLAGSADMALLAWTVGGLIALCGALTFAELGTRYPNAGGQYEILRDAYGPLPAFLFVFCNATAIQAGAIAIIALICAQNISMALTGASITPAGSVTVAVVLILGVTVANAVGVRWGAGIQNLTVICKLATIAVVIALAMLAGAGDSESVGGGGVVGGRENTSFLILLFAAIVPSFFAYGGWQHALWIAGEVREPRRNLPRAIVGGVVVVVAAYVLVNWAYLKLLGYSGVTQSDTLAADAVARVWPAWGRRFTAGAVAISALGVLNAQLLSGPRLVFRMAQDGRFFGQFARVSGNHGTPLAAIALLGGLGLTLLLGAALYTQSAIDAVDQLLTGVVFIDGVFFALTGAALFVLRRRDAPERADKDQAPSSSWLRYPIAAVLFVLGEIGILVGAYADAATRDAAVIGVGWILAAAILFLLFFRRTSRA